MFVKTNPELLFRFPGVKNDSFLLQL